VKSNLPVYYPVSFSQVFRDSVAEAGASSVPVDGPISICRDVYLTGEMGDAIKEQSLILRTAKGLVVISGCAHPGIVEILEKTREILDEEIYMVFGGFHLRQRSAEAMGEILERVRELGVRKCGPTHCTGDPQIQLFKKAYGEDFVPMGVGKVLSFEKNP
jgi:7,8-dihydropterin-6-yl-methyl-4-(beta-D-ribofuranosyl)aminobenzene 5'-phosphate synthase